MPETSSHKRQFALYLAGGVLSALIDVGTLQLLLKSGAGVAGATSAGFVAGLLFNYLFHSRVTFEAAASPARFTRYLCVVALNYLLTLACVTLADKLFGLPLAGKLVALPLVAADSYLLGRYWIFK